MAGVSAIFRQFVLDPLERRSPSLFVFRLLQLLHERAQGRLDRPVVGMISMLKPKVRLPSSALIDDGAIGTTVEMLRKRGWDILPFQLAPQSIAEIAQFAFSTPAYALDPTERIAIRESEPPQDHPRYEWRVGELIQLPAVQRLLRDSALYHVAQDYLGCRPVLTSIGLWLDVVHDRPYDAHIYHFDNDGPAFLKFFVYLSDVDVKSGAHTYIQGSHGHVKPEKFRRSRRYDRDDLLYHYGPESEIVFEAPAGTILAEDTAGFHRGMDPTARPRLLMQLQYAAINIPHVEEFALKVPRARIEGISREVAHIARKFACPA